jgi:hypothetical protein
MAFIPKDARWYLADLVLEHTVDGDPRNVVHVNIHLIEASSPEQAYEKALALGRESELVFTNTAGREVRVVFRGLRGLNVIHDNLEDGAELTYEEKVAVPESELATWVPAKEKLAVFCEEGFKRDIPNYMPESVMQSLEEAGFSRDELEGKR